MPEHVVDRLHRGERALVDDLDCVTILFADIVSYTNMTTQLKPTELVGLLNGIFTMFDSLCTKHAVTKVETIGELPLARRAMRVVARTIIILRAFQCTGEAYMVVVEGEKNANRMANMALDMINSVKDMEVSDLVQGSRTKCR